MKNYKNIINFEKFNENLNTTTNIINNNDDIINELYVPEEDRKMYDILTTFFGTNTGEILTVKIRKFLKKMQENKKDTWFVNGKNVNIQFFVKKYNEWNNQGGNKGYLKPSKSSVLEFLQNNFEDHSNDKMLNNKLLLALKEKNKLNESKQENLPYRKEYPFICEFIDRKPHLGQCYVLEINFEERKLCCSNGLTRLYPSFDDVIIKRFTLSTDNENIYVKVDFN